MCSILEDLLGQTDLPNNNNFACDKNACNNVLNGVFSKNDLLWNSEIHPNAE